MKDFLRRCDLAFETIEFSYISSGSKFGKCPYCRADKYRVGEDNKTLTRVHLDHCKIGKIRKEIAEKLKA